VGQNQRTNVVRCELVDGVEIVGYFTGLLFSRLGRILGSRFRGLEVALPIFVVVPANEGLSPSFPATTQLGIV
jgi:hypothetical protein